ncbi:MAG: hypothetical protein JO063_09895 [Pseudonocardiales bacterium]|nr:hypothetical protein [Pseudonocardiales bacterium]MBW0010409.1 hypothetical protein [Pseudonocardiales bacterium]
MNGNKDRTSFSPDGRTEQIINVPLSVTASDPADSPHPGLRAGYSGWSGDGMSPADVHGTRPGGPNRQERAHQVGAPESPT